MYAVVEDGGKQYRVSEGDVLFLECRDTGKDTAREAKTLKFDRVLLVGDGKDAKIGQPLVDGAAVTAEIAGEIKGPKLYIEKHRRRKGYHLRRGHRQKYLKVTVKSIKG